LAPPLSEIGKPDGIQQFSYQLSDDGLYALLELVARDRSAFAAILSDSRALKKFEKGKDKKEDIDKELKKFKKDFRFGPGPLPGGAQ
jgi:hypothetical protein